MLKISTRLFLPFFAFWALFAPMRAYAIVPLVLAAARISAAVLKTPTGQQLLVNAPIGIGLAYSIFSVTRTDGTNIRQDDLYLSDAPRAPSAVEAAAGFSAGFPSVAPAASSGAPVSAFVITTAVLAPLSSVSGGSAAAVCDAAIAQMNSGTWYPAHYKPVLKSGNTETTCGFTFPVPYGYGTHSISTALTCPVGYTASGGSCVLSNAAAVPRPTDNFCPIVRNGTSYAIDSLDPDCANGQAPTLTTTAAGGGLAVVPSFNGDSAEIERFPDGTMHIRYKVADAASNTTQQRDIALSPGATNNNPPIVSGVSDSTISGTGSSAGGSVAQTSDPATAAAIAANTAAIAELKTELTATGEVPLVSGGAVAAAATLAQSYADQAADVTQRAGGFGLPSLPGFLFPQFSAPACAPIGWSFQGHGVSFDICPHVPTIKSIAAWILNLLAAGICFQMLMNFRAMRVRG